jgi:hypothetical protein
MTPVSELAALRMNFRLIPCQSSDTWLMIVDLDDQSRRCAGILWTA